MEESPKYEAEAITIGSRFLLGDLLKFMVEEIKKIPMGWQVLPEKQQKEVIERLTDHTSEAVRQAVYLIASAGRPHILASLESVTFKDGVSMKLDIAKFAANRHELADAQGGTVLIVLPKVGELLKGDPPKAQPDQPTLPLDNAGAA